VSLTIMIPAVDSAQEVREGGREGVLDQTAFKTEVKHYYLYVHDMMVCILCVFSVFLGYEVARHGDFDLRGGG
jgi:hypothetical protein